MGSKKRIDAHQKLPFQKGLIRTHLVVGICLLIGGLHCSESTEKKAPNEPTDGGGGSGGSLVVPFSSPTILAPGGDHTCAIRSDHTVWCWGNNSYGQMGLGTHDSQAEGPHQVHSIDSAVSVTSGTGFSCAVVNDGSVWCWGDNSGNLGDGTTDDSYLPTKVLALEGVESVSAGESFTCAVTSEHQLWCWGSNLYGQLGIGSTEEHRDTPTRVKSIDSVVSVQSSSQHACVLKQDGEVWCWGINRHGQLGDGTQTDSLVPVRVEGISEAIAIEVSHGDSSGLGGDFSCAILKDYTAWCWGANKYGQLGDGTTNDSSVPVKVQVQVQSTLQVAEISAGAQHICLLSGDGTVWCLGNNAYGQLGQGTVEASLIPVRVTGIDSITSIASGNLHSCAKDTSSNILCWGDNRSEQLGEPNYTSIPQRAEALDGAVALSMANRQTCAVDTNGIVTCWGNNDWGQLGDGTRIASDTPVQTTGIPSAVAISTGDNQACIIADDHTVWCWGNSVSDHDEEYGPPPPNPAVQVKSLEGAVSIGVGDDHACARLEDLSLWCWGSNSVAQLGVVTAPGDSKTPVRVEGMGPVVQLAVGNRHTCCISEDGSVWCWGHNLEGQVDPTSNNTVFSPTKIEAIPGAVAISAGQMNTCAVLLDGSVSCWGENKLGQLGDGTATNSDSPVQVVGITNAVDVSVDTAHVCALMNDSTIRCWGYNIDGQLGSGTTGITSSQVTVIGLSDVLSIEVGANSSCALGNNEGWCWGSYWSGQVGNGIGPYRTAPIAPRWP